MGWPSGSLGWPNCSVPMLSVVCATISRMSGSLPPCDWTAPPTSDQTESLESKKQPARSNRRCYNPPILPVEQKDRHHEQITRPHRHRCFAFRLPAVGQQPICRYARWQGSLCPRYGFFCRYIGSCFRACCRIGCAGCFCAASIRHSRGRHGQCGAV